MIPWSYNHRTYHHLLKHLEVSIEPPTNIDRSIRTSYANRFILSKVTPGLLYFLVLGLKISNIHWSILKIEDQPVQRTYQIVTAKNCTTSALPAPCLSKDLLRPQVCRYYSDSGGCESLLHPHNRVGSAALFLSSPVKNFLRKDFPRSSRPTQDAP